MRGGRGPPNQRLQLTGARTGGRRCGPEPRPAVDRRIRHVWAIRPQLNREALGGYRRHAVTRARWWAALILISVTVLALDIATGPYILFPITFVVPVGLGAWFLSRTAGVGFAFALVLSRFGIALFVESPGRPLYATALNAAIRLLVLTGLAVLLAKVNRQQQALAHRVQVLEGILPICAFCKKIRRPDGVWEPIEIYITHRSAAQFSHGLCEKCDREHYGEDVLPTVR